MNKIIDNETVVLTGDLLLTALSDKQFPALGSFENVKTIDLQQLQDIDSAGVAYLAQIKSHYSAINIIGVSDKIRVLADLYGVNFLFKL